MEKVFNKKENKWVVIEAYYNLQHCAYCFWKDWEYYYGDKNKSMGKIFDYGDKEDFN